MFKASIADMKALARSRGGDCLSDDYAGVDAKLRWRCASGHIWENRPAKVKKGQWCPFCQGKHKSLAGMREFAKQRGVDCLSERYVNNLTPLRWRCKNGHEWDARPANVLFGTWCPFCCGQRQSIDDLRAIAESRGGNCLSSDYAGAAKQHSWRCKDGHTWQASPNSIKNGSWCPKCKINYGEEICREYLEAAFLKPFPKCRPDFLRTQPRGVMELDGYCAELGLAFEHQGLQHYTVVKHFHQGGMSLDLQRKRDEKKRDLCALANVRLIEVPQVPDITTLADLPNLLTDQLTRFGITPTLSLKNAPVHLDRVFNRSALERLQVIAQRHGGTLLSNVYLGDRLKLRWRCAFGHEWSAAPANIKQGSWCARCYGNNPKTLEEVRLKAMEKGITLLSEEYRGNKFKLRWRCVKGHEWSAAPQRILHDTGCPRCAGQAKSILDADEIAQRFNLRCLSRDYHGMGSPLEWECPIGHRFRIAMDSLLRRRGKCPDCSQIQSAARLSGSLRKRLIQIATERGGSLLSERIQHWKDKTEFRCEFGHQWKATPASITRGSWCPECAANARDERNRASRCGLEEMKTLAAKRGGVCLSVSYTSVGAKMRWCCARGHEWDAIPSNIKKGRWCPYCSGKARKTVNDMLELATRLGFTFLETEYLGDDKHHRWRCSQGHVWAAKPSNIKQGRGCPACAKTKRWVVRRQRMAVREQAAG